ncbi:MAG: hypothetical protein HY868_00310 [Chloroflexi bacterium]|nr:hypothetical protein [Chloroflexota bacterium]
MSCTATISRPKSTLIGFYHGASRGAEKFLRSLARLAEHAEQVQDDARASVYSDLQSF